MPSAQTQASYQSSGSSHEELQPLFLVRGEKITVTGCGDPIKMNTRNKPDTVPDRIWELWLDHKDTNYIWDPCADAPEYIHPRPATLKAIGDACCACVWDAVDRRFSEGATRFIFDGIQTATEGPNGSHALTPHAVRKQGGKRIARISRELREAIQEVALARTLKEYPTTMGELPLEIGYVVRQSLDDICASRLTAEKLDSGVSFALGGIVDNLNKVLEGLERGAVAWSLTRPEVNEKSSDPFRLFFIRDMTRNFRAVFDTPLREQVAALTRCLYRSEIDAATIAKLAP